MTSDWHVVSVKELAAGTRNALVGGPFGSNLKSSDYVAMGVPVIRGKNMGPGRWVSGDFVFVSEPKADSLRANIARPGDLLFTQRGQAVLEGGQVAIVPSREFERYVVSQSQMKLTPDLDRVDRLYLYFVFCSPQHAHYLRANAIQTGVPHTNLGILSQAPIPLPSLPEQRRIAAVLGALDDKIELNRKMNQTLEEMAQALFKSWFIDFDGHDDLVDSELGPIPRGWEVAPLLHVARLISGGTPKTSRPEFWGGDIKWASAKDVSNSPDRYLVTTERTITKAGLHGSSTKIIPSGSVAVVARGATCGRWCVFGEAMAINQTCYALAGSSSEWSTYVKHIVPALLGGLVQQAHGSIFDTITTRTFKSALVAVPPNKLVSEFHATVGGMEERILSNVYESRTLADLRDTLLPKLISGELRVPEAEELAEVST